MEEVKLWGMDEKTFLILMHLSQLTGFFVPGAGFILPVVMWATNKEQSQAVDRHGKAIFNWLLSLLIYSVVCFILIFVVVGVFAFFALMLISVIFVIIAAIKASEGVQWNYPLSIKFFQTTAANPPAEE